MPTFHKAAVVIACLLAALIAVTACQRESQSNPAPLQRFLNAAEAAWESADADAYAELLGPEFTFHFDDNDTALGAPDSWGRDEELDGVRKLFADAADVSLSFDRHWDFVEYPPDSDVLKVYEITYHLELRLAGELRIAQGDCNIRLQRYGEGRDEQWLCTDIWEVIPYEIGGDTTWGRLKFRHHTGTTGL
jgi:hypothetical protein